MVRNVESYTGYTGYTWIHSGATSVHRHACAVIVIDRVSRHYGVCMCVCVCVAGLRMRDGEGMPMPDLVPVSADRCAQSKTSHDGPCPGQCLPHVYAGQRGTVSLQDTNRCTHAKP